MIGLLSQSRRGRSPLLVDTVVAAAMAAVLLPNAVHLVPRAELRPPVEALLLGTVVLMHAALALRRIRVRASFLVVSLCCLVLVAAPALHGEAAELVGAPFPPILLPSTLVFAASLYAVSAHGRSREPLLALAVASVGALATGVRLWQSQSWTTGLPTGAAWQAFLVAFLAALVLAPWALGRLAATNAAYLLALEERAARAEQDRLAADERAAADERRRIAREMHDLVAHSLAVVVNQAEGGRVGASKDPDSAAAVFGTIARTGREALTEMRGLLGLLADGQGPTAVQEEGRAPAPTLAGLPELVQRVSSSGTRARWEEHGARWPMAPGTELVVYRTVQEGLTNVVKHAGPGAQALVELRWEPAALEVVVQDDGAGPPQVDRRAPGRGLQGLADRLGAVGGALSAGAAEHGGFRVAARVPRGAS